MKTKTYDFRSFVNRQHEPKIKHPTISLIPLAVAPFVPAAVHAESAEIKGKMMQAFAPIIDLIQGMAYPVAMVVVLGGAIFVMIGNSEKGFSMMQKAALGYLIVMISPMILNVLVDAVSGVAS
ncbi:hypothetical protein ACFSMW_06515 [Virgibacillus halophilus]|uniref:hypothetical protein n=1 Tax=Tigheibacillus halophilus TaxID=361280 RepID=UPI00362EC0B3